MCFLFALLSFFVRVLDHWPNTLGKEKEKTFLISVGKSLKSGSLNAIWSEGLGECIVVLFSDV